MKKTISVEFEEQAKSVVANVKIQYEDDTGSLSNQSVLDEAKQLFDAAWAYANTKSIQKVSPNYR